MTSSHFTLLGPKPNCMWQRKVSRLCQCVSTGRVPYPFPFLADFLLKSDSAPSHFPTWNRNYTVIISEGVLLCKAHGKCCCYFIRLQTCLTRHNRMLYSPSSKYQICVSYIQPYIRGLLSCKKAFFVWLIMEQSPHPYANI